MATKPHQLLLLADHIKITLLERERARSLGVADGKQDSSINRSLISMRDGVEALERQRFDQEAAGEDITDLADQISRLRAQYHDLDAEFQSQTSATTAAPPHSPTAATRPLAPRSSSMRNTQRQPSGGNKAVRFRDDPSAEEGQYHDNDAATRAALFSSPAASAVVQPYTDAEDAEEDARSNVQIYASHARTMVEQDEQLDTLGRSVRRQRDLSIQMGDELDDQNALLGDVEVGVDRHQGQLDRARKSLGTFSRRAKDNWSWVTIAGLIILLVLLIALVG